MTDNGDQAALNKLVDDCYPDGWPWEIWDLFIAETWPGYVGTIFTFVDNKPIAFYVKVTDHPDFAEADIEFKGGVPVGSMPLAGTWVEGRLMELMGEAFHSLRYDGEEWVCRFRNKKGWTESKYADTPIQALCAALHEVLKAQKEVDGEKV